MRGAEFAIWRAVSELVASISTSSGSFFLCSPNGIKPYNDCVDFEWDKKKATSNEVKHDVTFDEAKTVFANPLAVIFEDQAHSDDEDREIIVGHSEKNRVLLVSFTERANRIRIISARKATQLERKEYEDNAFGER